MANRLTRRVPTFQTHMLFHGYQLNKIFNDLISILDPLENDCICMINICIFTANA